MSERSLTYSGAVTPRAPALSPADRRASLVASTFPLLLQHGREVTTRQIAEAAGIAEGTIFRVFASKDALIDAVVADAFDLEPYVAAVESMDRSGSLEDVLTRVAELMIERFDHVFRLMSALALGAPPPHTHGAEWEERLAAAHRDLLAPHAGELRIPPREVMRYLRLLAFSGSNHHITDGRTLSAAEIADLVLHGARKDR